MLEPPCAGFVGAAGLAVPVTHQPLVAKASEYVYALAASPQAPGDAVLVAVHVPEVVPLFNPVHVHVAEPPSTGPPTGETALAVPVAQIVYVSGNGSEYVNVFAAVPQAPFIGAKALIAVHITDVAPPLKPTHVHEVEPPAAGFVGVAGLVVPAEQYELRGKVSEDVYDPIVLLLQTPSTFRGAEHEAVAPPPDPVHVHVQGPDPETAEVVPVEQRLDVGAEVTPAPLAVPQEPSTGFSTD